MKIRIMLFIFCMTPIYGADSVVNVLTRGMSYIWPARTSSQNMVLQDDQNKLQQKHLFGYIAKDDRSLVESCLRQLTEVPLGALCAAVKSGHVNIIRFLIDQGADVNERATLHSIDDQQATVAHVDDNGYTPLHYACTIGNIAAACMLIHNGALLQIAGSNKDTPLHCAARSDDALVMLTLINYACTDQTDYLLFFNQQDEVGNTPLMTALQNRRARVAYHLIHARLKEDQPLVNVNIRNYRKQTPLHYAARNGYKDLVESLIQCGSDVNALDDIEQTPLLHAIYAGFDSIVNVLLDANAQHSIGKPAPLRIAAKLGKRNIIERLLANRALLNPTDGIEWSVVADAQDEVTKKMLQEADQKYACEGQIQ